MNKRKRFIALLLCVLLTICALPLTALAAYAPVGTEDEPSSVRLYEYYSSAGAWEALKTPHHWNTQTGEIAYCLEHKNGTPRGDTYSSFDPTEAYPYAVYQGIYSILTFGYPAGGTGGLSAEQARYATANAIRFWLSESQEVYGMDFQQYNFTNLTRSNQYTRPKSGNSTAAAMWAYSMDLLNKARNGTTLQRSVPGQPLDDQYDPTGQLFRRADPGESYQLQRRIHLRRALRRADIRLHRQRRGCAYHIRSHQYGGSTAQYHLYRLRQPQHRQLCLVCSQQQRPEGRHGGQRT